MLPGGPLTLGLAGLEHDLHVRPGRPVARHPVGEQLLDLLGFLAFAAGAGEPVLERMDLLEQLSLLDLEPGVRQEADPLVLGVVANVGGVAQLLGLLVTVAREERVLDDDDVVRDAGHLLDRLADVTEVVRGDPRDDAIEGAVSERQILDARDHVGLHAGRGIGRDHFAALLAQPARHVAATRRDVEHLAAGTGRAPLDHEIEILALGVGLRIAVRLRTLVPELRHAASSTARFAPSSIVGSTCKFSGPASASSSRPSWAFVPSRRTTIGYWIPICSSAVRIPRATSSPRVIPPKMLKKIERTCGSAMITLSASTTPCASPPPPRSQKFAGRPPASATTSSVDMTRPAPLPTVPTSPSSFTYVTPFSRAARSSGGTASRSCISAMSGCLSSALSSTVTLASSARTSPSGVTMSGLTSQSIASEPVKHAYSWV